MGDVRGFRKKNVHMLVVFPDKLKSRKLCEKVIKKPSIMRAKACGDPEQSGFLKI